MIFVQFHRHLVFASKCISLEPPSCDQETRHTKREKLMKIPLICLYIYLLAMQTSMQFGLHVSRIEKLPLCRCRIDPNRNDIVTNDY